MKGMILSIFICTLVLSSLVPITSGVTQVNHSHDAFSIPYFFEHPSLTKVTIDGTSYDRIIMPNTPCGGASGEPRMPVKGAYILLPQGRTVGDIQVTPGNKVSLGSGYTIEPVSEGLPLSQPSDTFVRTQHQTNERGTNDLFTQIGISQSKGYEILVLNLRPMEYNPITGELSYYTELTVIVKTIENKHSTSLYRGISEDEQVIRTRVDNPDMLSTYRKNTIPLPTQDTYDTLIITTNELKNGFTPLQEFHNEQGTRTEIRTLITDIPVSYDPTHTCTNIRDYIRNEYLTNHIKSVLIGGDDDIIPSIKTCIDVPGGFYYNVPTDLYYACLDGPWNFDDDWKWGETHDGENGADVDLASEVSIGRACVGNNEEVNFFVEKTIAYLEHHENYLKNVLMVGERFSQSTESGAYMDQLIDGSSDDGYITVGIPSDDYTISTLYDRDWPDEGWPSQELITSINSGVHFINHAGHSSPIYNMKIYVSDIESSLTNTDCCFIYSQGCAAGYFCWENQDCIAEYFTVKNDHGAFAGIWNVADGYYQPGGTDGPSQRYQREFWDAIYGEKITSIGQANQDSKEDNFYRINEDYMRLCYFELTVFGDPSISFQNLKEIAIGPLTSGVGFITTTIENIGVVDADNIDWTLSVNGGLFGLIHVKSTGTIEKISVANETVIKTDKMVFGLGKINITVTVTSEDITTMTKEVTGFVFGPWIVVLEE